MSEEDKCYKLLESAYKNALEASRDLVRIEKWLVSNNYRMSAEDLARIREALIEQGVMENIADYLRMHPKGE